MPQTVGCLLGSTIHAMPSEGSCYSEQSTNIDEGRLESAVWFREIHACSQCGSRWFKRNGHIQTGKHNHRCKLCGRAFVLHPENSLITEEQRVLIERLLLERISLRGICRAMGVGLRWLLQFMVMRFPGGSRASPCQASKHWPDGTPAAAGGRAGRALELCGQEGELALGVDCDGRHDPAGRVLNLLME